MESSSWAITESELDHEYSFQQTQEEESTDMIKPTPHNLTRFKYAATLLGALAVVAFAPATAHALPVNNEGDGGCHYTDKDGYDVPIDEGQDVFVDGKIVSCRGGTIVVTTAPASAGGSGGSTTPPKVNIANLPRGGYTLKAG
jgi:hypothetical protein